MNLSLSILGGLFMFSVWIWMVTLISCLERVPDPLDPRLPKYIEDGRNIAGALLNDESWDWGDPISFFNGPDDRTNYYVNSDSLVMELDGNVKATQVKFGFVIQNWSLTNDIKNLDNTIITFNGTDAFAFLQFGFSPIIKSQTGQIYYRKVLVRDSVKFQLSGTFSFEAIDQNDSIYIVRNGRFDYITEVDTLSF